MMGESKKNVFIITDDRELKEVDYCELVNSFAEETLTPRGVERKLFVAPVTGYAVPNRLGFARMYEHREEAERDADECGVPHSEISEVPRWEGRRWNPIGGTTVVQIFDNREDAERWLFSLAQVNFAAHPDAPAYFTDRETALAWLAENT
ncbi:MAG: hypothetical protein LBL48_11725 [Azoarcus sp.]|jgi:hypothetical protein|nr:hypothetical protein [Azoarcus sp.]